MTPRISPPRLLTSMVAVLAGAGLVVVWGLLAWEAARGEVAGPTPTGPPAWLAFGVFASLAVAGAVAALRNAPLVTVVAAFVSLVPVGLWMLLVPGPGRMVGLLDLLLLGAGLLQWRATGPKGAPGGKGGSGGSGGEGG